MSTQLIDVANEAMFLIGEDKIQSLDSPTNRRDRLVASIIDGVRRDLLLAHRWNGATKRATLAADTATPDFGYDTQYDLPSDFLRLDRMEVQDQDYKIEGLKLLTDGTDAKIVYIADETDPNLLGPNFQYAMKFLLASRCAKPLTGNERLAASMRNEYDAAIADARYVDSDQHSKSERIRPSTFLGERLRYGQGGSTGVPLVGGDTELA